MAAAKGITAKRSSRHFDEDGGRGRRWWSEEETLDLLEMIGREKVVPVLDGKRQRNAHVFRRLAMLMDKAGYPRTPEQIRVRWKFLKSTYILDTRKHYGVNGTRSFNNAYSSAMANLMQQMAVKEISCKPTMRTRRQNASCSTGETPGVRMEVFTEPNDQDPDDEDEDVEDDDDGGAAAAGGGHTEAGDDDANGTTEMEKIMDTAVDCILDEASGTESAELRTLIRPCSGEPPEKTQKHPPVQQGIRPRTLNQYIRKDKVADKLIGIMQKQTRLMEEEQQWRREYVARQQRWEEQMLSTQMKQLETMMVNVTKMIMPMMNGNNPAASTSTSSPSWPLPPPQSTA